MKLQDITYKLTDKAIMPEKMGIASVSLYDWTKYNYYEDSIPEIDFILNLCKDYNMDAEFENCLETEVPHGYYRKYVYFFLLEVEEKTEITYFPRIPEEEFERYRHWIDGKIAFIGCQHSVYTICLDKGYHVFCIEYGVEYRFRDRFPLIRIEGLSNTANSIVSLTKNNYWHHDRDYVIKVKDHFITENSLLVFSLVPLDMVNFDYDCKIKMTIKYEESDSVLFEREISFKEEYRIDLSFLPTIADDYDWLLIICEAKDIHGLTVTKTVPVFRNYADPDFINKVISKAELLKKNANLPDEIKGELYYYTEKLSSVDNDFYYVKKLKNLFCVIENESYDEYLQRSGPHYIYYFSESDKHYYYYCIVLPRDYDKSKKYPLILTISHGHIWDFEHEVINENYSYHFSDRNDAIFADVGGRGCTLGSYMGEVFILREINDILNRYPIDSKRIYGIAHCAGNIALLNLAQTYPHLFAGIYTRMTKLYLPNINNLYNIPWMHLTASINEKDDFAIHRKQYEKELRLLKLIFVHKYYNADIELRRIQYTKESIDMLMSQELNEFPEIVYYRTERNRSRRAYYIEIEAIEKGQTFAEFHAEIVAYNLVISTVNCTGLKIKLPPQIDREHFYIRINGKEITFKKYYNEFVYLKNRGDNEFTTVESFTDCICYYKGTGLLDVYMSPLAVINCNINNDTMNKVANNFAHPVTNTLYSYIYVDYPIKPSDSIEDCKHDAIIIIDNNCKADSTLEGIRSMLPIRMNNKGYTYNNAIEYGDYCIMQVIANPWCEERSILYINTNNIDLYKHNLFTRLVKIPSYASGHHPYLNGCALLFDGNEYFSVSEWGNDFYKVT